MVFLTCIHAQVGLCRECQDEYDYDPESYVEFGDHPEGLLRWRSLQEEIAEFNRRRAEIPARDATSPTPNEIPF